MVMYVLAAALLPLVMAGAYQQQMMMMPQQQQWGNQQQQWGNQQQQWGNQQQQGWGNQQQQWGNQQQQQNNGGGQAQTGGAVQTGNNGWWNLETQEEYAAYMRWCEERKMAIAEQEAQQELLREITERQEAEVRAHEQEKAAKEMQMKRESMVAQWRMWESQLTQASHFDGQMDQYSEMKIEYMFKLTMEFLKFCSACTDNTAHLQRYLIHGSQTYEPPMVSDAFNLEDLEGIDITDVESVAQRLAGISAADGVKAFFGGVVNSMCTGVKGYVDQVKVWESQFNFMGV